ncbi:hypothetical protein [Yeosuana sp.]|uniref:hypothetical protein n=1 Tax=Yeosuana sp. TaxID=2529388 RepID=UPI004054D259
MNIIIEVSDLLMDNIKNIYYCIKIVAVVHSLYQKRQKQKKSDIEEKQQTNQKE